MRQPLVENSWPQILKIGPFDYSLIFKDGVGGQDGEPLYGQSVHHGERRIEIDREDTVSHWSAITTFFHEVLHAIDVAQGASDDALTEAMVNKMGKGLAMFFRDNPKVAELLKEE